MAQSTTTRDLLVGVRVGVWLGVVVGNRVGVVVGPVGQAMCIISFNVLVIRRVKTVSADDVGKKKVMLCKR